MQCSEEDTDVFGHFWLQHHPLLSVSAFCLHRYSVVNSAVCSSTFFFFFLIFIFPQQLPLLKTLPILFFIFHARFLLLTGLIQISVVLASSACLEVSF